MIMRMTDFDRSFKADEGCDYFISFYGRADMPIKLTLDIIDQTGETVKSTPIYLDPVTQKHYVRFKALTTGVYGLSFSAEDFEYGISYEITGIENTEIIFPPNSRKVIGVCAIWKDWENYNMALQALTDPKITKDYVIASFTFSQPFTDDEEVDVEKEFADIIKKFDIAALVLFAEMLKMKPLLDRLVEMGRELRVPVIVLEKKYPGVINGVLDYEEGFEKIVRHVTDYHGITDAVMIAGYKGNEFSTQREEIFKRVLRSKGVEVSPDDIIYGDFYAAKTQKELNDYLDRGKRLPKAFICANDAMAVGVCDCLKKRGIKVPDDCLVTGFDGTSCGKYYYPVITSCKADLGMIADTVLRVIKENEEGKEAERFDFPIGFKELINGSCGCCKRDESAWRSIVSELAADNQDYFYHDIQMGMFSAKTVNLDDLDSAMTGIEEALSLWTNQYYFVGITSEPSCVHAILRGGNGNFLHKERFYSSNRAFPDYWDFVQRGSGKNIMLIRQIRSYGQCHGYIVSCLDKLTLRAQERFEEFGIYMSIIVNSVIKQQGLKAANDEVKRSSEHDYLTGLYNRRGFLNRCVDLMSGKEGSGRYFTLMSIDMDGLKHINDTYGHRNGDLALQILSHSLRDLCERSGICARYGGDEFAIALTSDIDYGQKIDDLRKKIADLAAAESHRADIPFTVGASAGAASIEVGPNAEQSLETLLQKADEMMYLNKVERKKVRKD